MHSLEYVITRASSSPSKVGDVDWFSRVLSPWHTARDGLPRASLLAGTIRIMQSSDDSQHTQVRTEAISSSFDARPYFIHRQYVRLWPSIAPRSPRCLTPHYRGRLPCCYLSLACSVGLGESNSHNTGLTFSSVPAHKFSVLQATANSLLIRRSGHVRQSCVTPVTRGGRGRL